MVLRLIEFFQKPDTRGLVIAMNTFELSTEQLESRDSTVDSANIGIRIENYRLRQPSDDRELIIDENADPDIPAQAFVPEVNVEEFNAEVLRSAIGEHGALIVRDMFPKSTMDTLITATDRVLDSCAKIGTDHAPVTGTYFNPPVNLESIMPNRAKELGNTRNWHRDSGSSMCVEAPSVAETLLKMYEAYGLRDIISDYFGEPPCLSCKKWVLRRSRLPVSEAGWHQDGAFMGTDINSINMWIPLTKCGGETGAPGMDVVPLRLNDIASAEGAQFHWSVSDSQANSFGGVEPVAPVFNAGDAFFFDHFYLHRTQYRTDFTKLRYAIETWFFGASSFPKNQIPVAW